MRPSRDKFKDAQRNEAAKALEDFLGRGGEIQQLDSGAYKREAGTLSREQVVKTFAYQSQIDKIKKEAQEVEEK
ncbi:MAG: hypothetical protein CMO61_00095 [Verrucomicrobiales bacterium]|nr:hypothetical protein [Verrucomicrobiales bacterium]